jgi:squalene-hopene cyclase-like protein
MSRLLLALILVPAALWTVPHLVAAEPDPKPEALKTAVEKALPLIQKGAAGYVQQRGCFSCHHQALPVLALSLARERGFPVDEKVLQEQLKFTETSLRGGRDAYRQGRGQGGQATTAGYGLLALEWGGWKADETTAAVTEYLLQWNRDLDHWRPQANRPPSEASRFSTTFVALRGLAAYGTTEQKERITARIEKVREWLLRTAAADTEERVFRLWSLKYAAADPKEIQAAARELLESQREDGGWAQTADLKSDAYATGSALVALHEAGGLAVTDPAYRKGLQFLVRTQAEDGSWHVQSRSRPFQPYFESGFPYGNDQFISIAATSWATAALALACPKSEMEPQMNPDTRR